MTRQFAQSGNVSLSYSVEGEGKETVLLVMGLGGRAADWGTQFPSALAARYRVVRMDHRGVGGSPPVPGGYTLNDMAKDVTAVLDAVGAARAHVVGYSMGGMISQLVATEHASRVERLVLVSTHFGGADTVPPTPEAMQLFDPQEMLNRGRSAESIMRFTMSVLTAKGFLERSPAALELMVANVRAEPTAPVAFMGQMQAIIGSDRGDIVRKIDKPTLVIHGTDDTLVPVGNGHLLKERIPGARLAILEGVGHMPMLEAPDELADLVLGFLE
ncbi:MAG TPA: alpha/beta fold hydrolase [Polyangiaceae bacterium]|jgi:pimeloyl-ACP methyl ester carboxylesterase|nr:alpha/beta fold hydrolase [Polyangiaceae bacterium]